MKLIHKNEQIRGEGSLCWSAIFCLDAVFCKATVREKQIICLGSSKKKNLNENYICIHNSSVVG